MIRRLLRFALGAIVLAGLAAGLSCLLDPLLIPRLVSRYDFYEHGVEPGALPALVRDADLPAFGLGSMDEIVGLAGKNLRGKNLRAITPRTLSRWTFDTNTRWPPASQLPSAADPQAWLTTAMDPGLDVRALHQRGITGKGVGVAVIDKPILSSHREFAGRIHYRKAVAREGLLLHFHGISCASILAGRSCGVAPEATLHYFSVPDVAGDRFVSYSRAIDELLAVNETLPAAEKIRVVSISDGYDQLGAGHPWARAEARARAAGVTIVYATRLSAAGFGWGGCPPMADRGVAENYVWADFWQGEGRSTQGRILVPSCFRTTASNTGRGDYIYWAEGGFSWAIAYVAGVMALGSSVNPQATGDEIIDIIKATATRRSAGDLVIDPVRAIERLEGLKVGR